MDNEHEVDLVHQLLQSQCCLEHNATFGLRINPVVGGGDLAFTSTATKASKFGLPITDGTKSRILELFKTHEWLSGVHFHVGSQGVPLDLFVQGAKINSRFDEFDEL